MGANSGFPYYVEAAGHGTFNLRQERFRGQDHPCDVMAVGFTADGMREIVAKHFAGKVDMTALGAEPLDGLVKAALEVAAQLAEPGAPTGPERKEMIAKLEAAVAAVKGEG